jgi:hypothetical protein
MKCSIPQTVVEDVDGYECEQPVIQIHSMVLTSWVGLDSLPGGVQVNDGM